MDNELVHVLRRVWEPEPSNAITAALRRAKGDIKQRSIAGRQNRKVVGHFPANSVFLLPSMDVRVAEAKSKLLTGDMMSRGDKIYFPNEV